MKDGRRFARPPAHTSLPSCRPARSTPPTQRTPDEVWPQLIRAYNAQAAVTEQHIIVAAEITTEGRRFEQLEPIVTPTERELSEAGVTERPGVVLADAGY
jgi:hypothetical protein